MVVKFVVVFSALLVFSNALKSYENFKVFEVVPNTEEHLQMLTDLRKSNQYDFWNEISRVGDKVKIMVSPEKQLEFVQYANNKQIKYTVSIDNVQRLIDNQNIRTQNPNRDVLGSFDWEVYHTLNEIYSWLDELAEMYPDVVTTFSIGTSNEGRIIKGIKIDLKTDREDPLIGMIEGGIHPVEWISPATVTWIIKEFLTSADPEVRSMADSFVWHIIPVVNPDGYEYTFTEERMWRKNRTPANYRNCTDVDDNVSNGIDLNRNFDFLWMTVGASDDPCSHTYAGPSAASEPETRALANYILELTSSGRMIYYLAFHSYSQMILIPYSHATGEQVLDSGNYGDMYEVAIRGANKLIERHGTDYIVGTAAEILYQVSGSSFDWVKGVTNVPMVYVFELRDRGQYGFLLPSEQIIPNNEEIMDCLVEMDRVTRQLGYYSGTNTIFGSITLLVFTFVYLVLID